LQGVRPWRLYRFNFESQSPLAVDSSLSPRMAANHHHMLSGKSSIGGGGSSKTSPLRDAYTSGSQSRSTRISTTSSISSPGRTRRTNSNSRNIVPNRRGSGGGGDGNVMNPTAVYRRRGQRSALTVLESLHPSRYGHYVAQQLTSFWIEQVGESP
jgi:hypothetical protein